MTTQSLPALFLPHGAPDLPLANIPAANFLRGLGASLPRPDGIIIVSAHWETSGLQFTTVKILQTIYDFGGFAPELYQLKYPAETSAELITSVEQSLQNEGYTLQKNHNRGLDHGAWVPLLLAYPAADIPVVQLSLDTGMDPKELFDLGRALAPLRRHNILIIGSGATVHNLRHINPEGSAPPGWATGFDGWLNRALTLGNWDELLEFNRTAHAEMAHPTPEHLLPLFVAAGAGSSNQQNRANEIHRSYSYGSIGMSAWEFAENTWFNDGGN